MKYIRGCEVSQLNTADDFYDVYLKSLLGEKVKTISKENSHNLKTLYDRLNKKIKEKIKINPEDTEYSIEELLESIGNGFIEWRYIYEDGNEDFGGKYPFQKTEYFLITYLNIIKQVAHDNDKTHR